MKNNQENNGAKKDKKQAQQSRPEAKTQKATLRVGVYRIAVHPDFGQRKNRSQADIKRHQTVSAKAGGGSSKSVLHICQAARVALLRSPILLADKNSITDLENA